MKTKQLANVLIKILGLSVVVQGIPGIIVGLISAVPAARVNPSVGVFIYPLSSMAVVGIGIFLIIQSRAVATFLFQNDDD